MIVTFSGIDGSGKTTRCLELTQLLQERGLPARVSKPVYEANEAVKDFCQWAHGDRFAYFNRLNAGFYISCLTADWLAYLARVLSRATTDILVCDRYIFDVLAQAVHMRARATTLCESWHLFPKPDIGYFLEVSPEVAYARLQARRDLPMHVAESLDELRVLHTAYQNVTERMGWNRVVVLPTTSTKRLAEEVECAWLQMRVTESA